MGDTGRCDDESAPRPGAGDAPAPIWHTYYRPLVRLAALLTSDPGAAEAVAADALAAVLAAAGSDPAAADFLVLLQHEVVARSRRGRHYRRVAQRGRAPQRAEAGEAPDPGQPQEPAEGPEFTQLPVVQALRGLQARLREAIVLTHYLDLPEARAAAVAGVTEAALRANLASAMRALTDAQITGPFPDS